MQIFIDNVEIPVKFIEFSDKSKTLTTNETGATAINSATNAVVNLDSIPPMEVLTVYAQVATILGRSPVKHVTIYLPYLPFARADRIFEPGNSLPIEALLLGLHQISEAMLPNVDVELLTVDVHNDKYPELVFGSKHKDTPQHTCVVTTLPNGKKYDYVIAPDKGAVQKATQVAKLLNAALITATKTRDIATGKITSTTLSSAPEPNSTVLIVDDILDGGGTFIPLGLKLKEFNCVVDLYVTHLIAAKGLKPLENAIDSLYAYNIVGNYVTNLTISEFNSRWN